MSPKLPHDDFAQTSPALRLVLGTLVLELPVALYLAGAWLQGIGLQPSISAYYHSDVRDILVGVLCAIGLGLIACKRFGRSEDWALNLGGVLACPIALLAIDPAEALACIQPACTGDCLAQSAQLYRTAGLAIGSKLHFPAAISFYAVLGYVMVFCSHRTLHLVPASQRRWYLAAYPVLGTLFFGSMLAAFVLLKFFFPAPADLCRDHRLCWVEVAGIVPFADSATCPHPASEGPPEASDQRDSRPQATDGLEVGETMANASCSAIVALALGLGSASVHASLVVIDTMPQPGDATGQYNTDVFHQWSDIAVGFTVPTFGWVTQIDTALTTRIGHSATAAGFVVGLGSNDLIGNPAVPDYFDPPPGSLWETRVCDPSPRPGLGATACEQDLGWGAPGATRIQLTPGDYLSVAVAIFLPTAGTYWIYTRHDVDTVFASWTTTLSIQTDLVATRVGFHPTSITHSTFYQVTNPIAAPGLRVVFEPGLRIPEPSTLLAVLLALAVAGGVSRLRPRPSSR